MTRRRTPFVEVLEDRRLFSATPLTIAPGHRPSVGPAAASARVHPADDSDDGGDTDAGGSTDSGSTDSGSTDSGSTGSSDAGDGSADDGDLGSTDGGSFSDDPVTTDPTPTTNDDGSSGTTGGATTGGDSSTAVSGSTTTDDGSAGGDDLLYPTGDPGEDDLYDDDGGGGTLVVVTPLPGAANFGGTLHVRLPAKPVAGDDGVATLDVFNTGGRAVGPLELAVGVSPDGSAASAVRVGTATVDVRLGHDRVAAYRVRLHLPATLPAGSYRFLGLIDAGSSFAETDESDNVALGPTVAIGAAAPDLAVTGVTAARAVRPGRPLAVTVRLAEAGTVPEVGSATVTLMATPSAGGDPVPIAVTSRPVRLTPGHASTVRFRLTLPALPAGQYRLTATVTAVSAADGNAADKSAVATFRVLQTATRAGSVSAEDHC